MFKVALASARAALLALILLAATIVATPARQGHGLLPEATPVDDPGAWSVVERQELEVAGEFVTLSPDSRWIAGIGPDFELCVWEVATLDATCGEQEVPIEADSIRWAPDSTAVAWSVPALRIFQDSDIFLMEIPAGEVTNLTDDGFADTLPLGSDEAREPIPVDIMPAWTPDSQSLVFVRSVWSTTDDDEAIPTDLMSIARAGGEPVQIATVRDDFPWAVFFPIFVLDDGSLLYSVAVNDLSDHGNGIWLMDPAGETTQLLGGAEGDDYPGVAIVDVSETSDGLLVSGFSAYLANSLGTEADPSFLLDTATGTVTPLSDSDDVRASTPVRFSPDDTATVGMEWLDNEPHLVVRDESGASDLGAIEPSRGTVSRGYDWAASNVILVPNLSAGGVLLTVEPSPDEG